MTETDTKTAISNVCSLDSNELAQRAKRWTALRDAELQTVQRTETNARFEYPRSSAIEEEVDALIQAEQACCAVDGMTWSVEKTETAVAVCITIPESLRDSKEVDLILAAIGGL